MADPNTQAQGTPDEYSTPLPQGASSGPQDEYSTPIPQGASALPTMGAANSHSLFATSSHKQLGGEGILSDIGGVAQGAGEAAFSGLAGLTKIVDKGVNAVTGKHISPVITDSLADLSGEGVKGTGATTLGYGGETLLEFLAGDAALKGLSLPDKLAHMGSTFKILQQSPKLMAALKLGAAAIKSGTELAPEEASLLAKYPKLAKLVGLGAEAAKAGTVQGTQTLVRTGGDTGAAAKDAAGAAVLTGALHGATGAAKHVLGKGKQAAQTVQEMTARGAAAPTAAEVSDQLGSAVNDAYKGETGTLQNNLDDATSTIQMAGEGAPQQSQITSFAQKQVANKRKALSDEYTQGLQKLSDVIDHDPENPATIPYEGSPLHQVAQSLVSQGLEDAGPLDKALQKTRPGSARANNTLDMLADLNHDAEGEEGEAGQPTGAGNILSEFAKSGETAPEAAEAAGGAGGAEGAEGEGTPINLKQLTEYRRVLGERMRNLGYSSADDNADRQVYKKLIQGVDDTIAHLADSSSEMADGTEGAAGSEGDFEPGEGDEDAPATAPGASGTKARAILDQMNTRYRNGIRLFQNADVKSLLKGNVNDVSKKLMAGQTSLDDINAVKKVIGPDHFKALGDASLQNMVRTSVDDSGDLDYKKLFKQYQRINPDVRKAMFGETGDSLSKALNTAVGSSNALDEIGKNIQSLLGNGSLDAMTKSPEKIAALSKTIGPAGMKTLGQSLLEQKIGEASTRLNTKTGEVVADRFDPDKVIEWWNSFKDKPEVRDQLFHPDAESKQQYTDLMKRLGQAASFKKLVKYGLLPATVGTAGVVHGPLAALIAATAGLGAEQFGSAKSILDNIANNPRTWKFFGSVGNAAIKLDEAPAAKASRRAAYNVMSSAANAMGSASTPSDYTGDDQPLPKTKGDVGEAASVSPKEPIVKYENPEDEPSNISYARNKEWSKPGPYITKLTAPDEAAFQKWAKANPKLVDGELNTATPDYDVRGRWLAEKHGDPEAKLTRSAFDGTLHASDKWKTPYDAVFSRESKYALPNAPGWEDDRLVTHDGRLVVDETPKKKGNK